MMGPLIESSRAAFPAAALPSCRSPGGRHDGPPRDGSFRRHSRGAGLHLPPGARHARPRRRGVRVLRRGGRPQQLLDRGALGGDEREPQAGTGAMTERLLARDVTELVGDLASGGRLAVSAGIVALTEHPDPAKSDRMLADLLKLILTAPGYRRDYHEGKRVVTTPTGRRFVLFDGVTNTDGTKGLAIVTYSEVQLAGTFDLELDVRERVGP